MSRFDRIRIQQTEEASLKKGPKAPETSEPEHATTDMAQSPAQAVLRLQRTHGNQAVRRMLARVQRSVWEDGGPINTEISDEINSKRGQGSSLDGQVQADMSAKLGRDFSDVSVHTDAESDQLNQTLGARAFTTGSDVFFSAGAYNPGTSEGQHLIAHELTHVVHQDGSAPSGNLTLGPANDSYEQQAEQMATAATSQSQPAGVQAMSELQRQEIPEEEELAQAMRNPDVRRQAVPEEEELQMMRNPDVQRQEMPEDEEELMMMRDPDIQRQEVPEEEELLAG